MGSPSPPGTPFCLHYFDMLYSEDVAWAAKGMGETSQSGTPGGRGEVKKEPEQCPIIDSQGLGLGGDGELQGGLPLEEHSLEQMQSMVVGEVLKDIETACKLLNIAAGGCMQNPPPPKKKPTKKPIKCPQTHLISPDPRKWPLKCSKNCRTAPKCPMCSDTPKRP